MKRRETLKRIGLALAAGATASAQERIARPPGTRVKISCNLYSFDRLLRDGVMSLEKVFEFCAGLGFDAVDPTGYYFPGYPAVPPDDYICRIKRKAFLLGLDISGTGVRNDFAQPDSARRDADLLLVRQWVECAARLGAPALRVFSGREAPAGHSREKVLEWVVQGLRQSAEHGAKHGVMIALQNHWDFVRTADETLEILKRVDSDWFAINLDVGSYRSSDPYEEIARIAPYAVTWQIKEQVYRGEKREPVDLARLAKIFKDAGYRGYIPLETLEGDPRIKLPKFIEAVRQALA